MQIFHKTFAKQLDKLNLISTHLILHFYWTNLVELTEHCNLELKCAKH